MFCAKFGWNRPSCSGEEDFYISSMYLGYFRIISSQKRAGPLIWTNLTPLHPRMLCSKFGWKWPSDSGDEYFLNFVNVFSLFPNYLPLEKVGAIHLNKLESPLHQDWLCQVWFKLAQWFWRRRWKCKKFMTTTTDNGQMLIWKAHLSQQNRYHMKLYTQ